MSEQDGRAASEVWEEIVRTSAQIRGYRSMLEGIEGRLLDDSLTGDDAKAMSQVVSDAELLASLIGQLDQRRALAFE